MKKLISGLFLSVLILTALLYISYFAESTVRAAIYEPEIDYAERWSNFTSGKRIVIEGSNFDDGARVIFNAVVKDIDDEKEAVSEAVYKSDQWYDLIDGIEGTNVVVGNNGETILVDSPYGRPIEVREYSVMVINPDKTASELHFGINDIFFGISEPRYVETRLVNDRYILVHWSKVSSAKEYEVYVSTDKKRTKQFIGTTRNTSYIFDDLERNTEYRFYIRAVGDLGISDFTSYEEEETDKKVKDAYSYEPLDKNTLKERAGNTATVTFSSEDFYSENSIDLTKGEFIGCNKVIVNIPAKIISNYQRENVQIISDDFIISFNPSVFESAAMKSNDDDIGVRLEVLKLNEDANMGTRNGLVSSQYLIRANRYVGDHVTRIDSLEKPIDITLTYSNQKVALRKYSSMEINRYNDDQGTWEEVSSKAEGSKYLTASISKLGKYAVVGKR